MWSETLLRARGAKRRSEGARVAARSLLSDAERCGRSSRCAGGAYSRPAPITSSAAGGERAHSLLAFAAGGGIHQRNRAQRRHAGQRKPVRSAGRAASFRRRFLKKNLRWCALCAQSLLPFSIVVPEGLYWHRADRAEMTANRQKCSLLRFPAHSQFRKRSWRPVMTDESAVLDLPISGSRASVEKEEPIPELKLTTTKYRSVVGTTARIETRTSTFAPSFAAISSARIGFLLPFKTSKGSLEQLEGSAAQGARFFALRSTAVVAQPRRPRSAALCL